MAENTEISPSKEDPKGPQNLFSLFPKFKLEIPFLKHGGPKVEAVVKKEVKGEIVVGGDEGKEDSTKKPDVVKFAERKPLIPPPLAVEAEETSAKTSNPFILWQVYALGGFIVLKWIWGRWQERKAQKGPDDGDNDESSDAE
ncbi:hypothetical protein SO802_009384 [Lithocarpus litseifolius]|uniref:Uncharacterized protein n=1 Tax=Lithocarpus litseifolius TaxID=425828 RepID=A0AAW2DB88_9ROSI